METVDLKIHALVSLKIDEAREVASFQLDDVSGLKIHGGGATGAIKIEGLAGLKLRGTEGINSVKIDDNLESIKLDTAEDTASIKFWDVAGLKWDVTQKAANFKLHEGNSLKGSAAMADSGFGALIGLLRPGSDGVAGIKLDGIVSEKVGPDHFLTYKLDMATVGSIDSFKLGDVAGVKIGEAGDFAFHKQDVMGQGNLASFELAGGTGLGAADQGTANNQNDLQIAGDIAGLKIDEIAFLKLQAADAVAAYKEHQEVSGEVTSYKIHTATDLSPANLKDPASDKMQVDIQGKNVSFKLDEVVFLKIEGMEMLFTHKLAQSGDEIMIDFDDSLGGSTQPT
jgi:hypothetical protein